MYDGKIHGDIQMYAGYHELTIFFTQCIIIFKSVL